MQISAFNTETCTTPAGIMHSLCLGYCIVTLDKHYQFAVFMRGGGEIPQNKEKPTFLKETAYPYANVLRLLHRKAVS